MVFCLVVCFGVNLFVTIFLCPVFVSRSFAAALPFQRLKCNKYLNTWIPMVKGVWSLMQSDALTLTLSLSLSPTLSLSLSLSLLSSLSLFSLFPLSFSPPPQQKQNREKKLSSWERMHTALQENPRRFPYCACCDGRQSIRPTRKWSWINILQLRLVSVDFGFS